MMNHQEAMELERAIDRAAREGIHIMGRGTRKSDGARVFAVSSSQDASRGYLVVVHAGHLACECPARKICKHRAAVHLALVAEATAARVKREAVAAAQAQDRDTAPLHRDSRPFSIWK